MLGRGRVPLPLWSLLGARSLASSSRETSLYELLGVAQSADKGQIKAAFRQKAKLLHPDTSKGDQAAFVKLVTAYQVLSNPRSKELYDLSIKADSSFIRKAAAAGVRGGAGAVDEEPDIDISWGLSELLKPRGPPGEQSTMLDKLRSELQSDINVALRHAYLGPKLDLPALQLPECFEADERSTLDAADLLELVSGRQLLGVVRERRAAQLAGRGAAREESLPGGSGGGAAGAVRWLLGWAGAQAQPSGTAAAAMAAGPVGPEASQQPAAERDAEGRTAASCDPADGGRGSDAQSKGPGASCQGAAEGSTSAGSSSSGSSWDPGIAAGDPGASSTGLDCAAESPGAAGASGKLGAKAEKEEQEPEVLELILEEQLVATAVRRRQQRGPGPGPGQAGPSPTGGTGNGSRGGGSSGREPRPGGGGGAAAAGSVAGAAGAAAPGSVAEEEEEAVPRVLVVRFYRGERLLGELQAEHEAAASNSPSAARFLNPQGVHTHTVLRSSSPLVRHLSIVAEPTTGIAPARRSKATVFRARRAWLPPSTLWLFRPRNYEHDIGGWYIEWVGHGSSSHPAWLDPSICVLMAGFDTLDHERARQQPQGLFGRVRAGDETAGGPMSWLRAMLRFHGVRRG